MKNSENLKQLTRSLIKLRFSEYYKKNEDTISPPQTMERREFGFLLFSEGQMIRHRSFTQISGLRKFIETTVPSDVYYSAAYYADPESPMDRKGWIGSDLIFDIDADHIDTECKKIHDRWVCVSCKASGHGKAPQNCPDCKGQRLREDTWMCQDCLEKAREEVLKLINVLNSDFGISLEHMKTNFSGHRGYHLHVDSEDVKSLSSEERKEMTDYITGTGLDPALLGLYDPEGRLNIAGGPTPNDPGWKGRLAKRLEYILFEANQETLKRMDLTSRTVDSIVKSRSEEPKGDRPYWRPIEGVGRHTWKLIIHKAVSLESVNIDTVVTTDTHRLIRLPETLNGKTGFRAMQVKMDELPQFNPLRRAAVFEGHETVHVEEAPRFMIGGEEYGPFNHVDVTVPTAAAILMLCKGRAHPVIEQVA
jgi:DNA primase small subunit